MLNAQDIAKRIALPSLSTKEDQDYLNQLAKEYPYSQIFSILYLKALKQSKDVRFEEELKAHSFRITDRTQLYYLIHQEDTESAPESVSTRQEVASDIVIPAEKQELPPIEESIESKSPHIEESNIEENILSNETSQEALDSESSAPEISNAIGEVKASEEDSQNIELPLTEEKSEIDHIENVPLEKEESILEGKNESNLEIDTDPPLDSLEETILHHVYAANYRLDELTEEEKKNVPPKKEKNREIRQGTSSIKSEERSFTSWFQADKNFVEPVVEENDQIRVVVTQFKEFDPTNDLFGEIEKPKKEFFSATKKGKVSLAEERLPVSETLAKIYEMQGNYPKAISAYEQLSLINSEKRTYFASLIEKLKKKLNSE